MNRHTMSALLAASLAATVSAGCLRPEPGVVTAPPARPTVGEPTTEAATSTSADPTSAEPTTQDAPSGEVIETAVTETQAQSFISRANMALDRGDAEGWRDLIFLEGEELAQQQTWFAGVQAVPMFERSFDLLSSVPDEDGQWRVEFVHRIIDADRVPVVESYTFELGQLADGTVGITGVDGLGPAYPQLWDVAEIEVITQESSVILHEVGADVDEQLAQEIDRATELTFEQWPAPDVNAAVVTLASTEQVATLFGGEETPVAGFMTPVPKEFPGDISVGRVVLDLPYSNDELRYYDQVDAGLPLMRHEGAHLALHLQSGRLGGPEWAIEGLPTWWEGIDDEAVGEDLFLYSEYSSNLSGLEPSWPPADYQEFYGEDEQTDRSYTDSALVFAYIAETYGEQAAIEFGTDLNHAEGDPDEWTQEATQEHLGVSADQLRQDWEAWIADVTR